MILVFGKTGQVAQELAQLPGVFCLGREDADLMMARDCADQINRRRPAAVINAAAYTAVDQAESDEENATRINAKAPEAMAKACADLDIPFVQISTDYVFSGQGDIPWQPDDQTAPLGAYGRSKLAGERAVQAAGGRFAILRCSWVVSAHGANFVKTMLALGAEREALNIVADQIGGPTAAADIAVACHRMALQLIDDPAKAGIYHFAGAPECSWADFARAIFNKTGLNCAVTDIASSDYPTPARRPLNSRMDCTSTADIFGITRPDWRDSLTPILTDLGAVT
jgi:dTDP-4-dehydrorhamnose reductase